MGGELGGHLAIWLMRKLFPLPPGYAAEGPSLEELRPIYNKWHWWGLAALLPTLPLFTVVWWAILRQGMHLYAWRFEPAAFQLYDDKYWIWVPAGLLGALSAGALLTWLYKRWLGERYSLYIRFEALDSELNPSAGRWFVVLLIALTLVSTQLVLNWRVVFRDADIEFRSPLGINEVKRRYDEITDIHAGPRPIKRGKAARREFVIKFKGGQTWSTDSQLSSLSEAGKQDLLKFVAAKAKKPVQQVAMLR